MTPVEAPEHAELSASERVLLTAPGIAQRGSMLTDAPLSFREIRFPTSSGALAIEIAADPPVWFVPTVERLGRLLTMPRGWDTYGARPVAPACAVAALRSAFAVMEGDTPAPAVVPLSCGGVQFEWHAGGIDLEIEFRSPSLIAASCEDHQVGESWEEQVFDFSRIRRALRELVQRTRSGRSH